MKGEESWIGKNREKSKENNVDHADPAIFLESGILIHAQ
jgi:hypothetical protein